MISELAFSHKDSEILACVDEGGNVYVWTISEQNGNLEYPFLERKQIEDNKMSWCRLCVCILLLVLLSI